MDSANFEYPKIDWDTGDLYGEFCRFKDHVQFVFSGPLATKTDKEKAGWLGTWLGQQGREIYKTFDWDDDGDKDKPTVVLEKFKNYVQPRKNKRINRYKLKQRKQTDSESFDNFVKDLRLILLDCEFHDSDDILVDCIISGVYDKKLQERLLDCGEDLTLAQALVKGQQFELSKRQIRIVRDDEDPSISAVRKYDRRRSRNQPSGNRYGATANTKSGTCGMCGRENHGRGKCPASGTICSYCKKPNHWKIVCRKRLNKLNSVESDRKSKHESGSESSDEPDVLNVYTAKSGNKSEKWDVKLNVCETKVPFRIDTGARCNTIKLSDYDLLKNRPKVHRSAKILHSFTNHKLKPLGFVNLEIKHKKKHFKQRFELIDINQENILSGETSEQLGLIARLESVKSEYQDESEELVDEFPDVLKNTGTLPGEYKIKIDENAIGVAHPVRRQPVFLKKQIIEKLNEMESEGHIIKVTQPTEWVSSMVASYRNNKVRICIDPSDLNKVVKREHHPMKTIEEVISEIPGSKVFSVLDAKSGFLQIRLDEKSSYLTTFNSPTGRYRFSKLPFGLKCSPEIFQRIMDQMLETVDGAIAIMDDILIAAKDVESHDKILNEVMNKATEYNLKLNLSKCQIRKSEVKYVGHILSANGVKPDPDKIEAVLNMPPPADKTAVKRLIAFATYLGKFIPNLSSITAPIRTLLKENTEFSWQLAQQKAFENLKKTCCNLPVLKFYDVNEPVEIQCDASQFALGAVLLQNGSPIAYASRSLTDTEKRYAQIEKEMLSIVFACKKFHCYIFGKTTSVLNDHKPLEMIFTKPLLSVPLRLQRMMISLQRYDLNVKYRKGTEMILPDTLSRAPLKTTSFNSDNIAKVSMLSYLSVTDSKYNEIQSCTQKELNLLQSTILAGWPDQKQDLPYQVRPYWDSRSQLAVVDGIIYKGLRIVVPPSMQSHMLKIIHDTHLGIVKCKQRAREALYWPAMNAEIEENIKNCSKCATYGNKQQYENLKPTELHDYPFYEVGTDLFEFESKNYLILVDYYSKFIEVNHLKDITTKSVIYALKTQFARHGIPRILRSDCGSQYMSQDFKKFCLQYDIQLKPSSPYYHRSNGEAERAVQTVKNMWRKNKDKYMALLTYRTTPLEGINLSPAQLLTGRRFRNTLPIADDLLKPTAYNQKEIKQRFKIRQEKQKHYHDKPSTKPFKPLQPGESVRMTPLPGSKDWKPAVVIEKHKMPRSYILESNGTKYRRNRSQIKQSTELANKSTIGFEPEDIYEDNIYKPDDAINSDKYYTTRSGRKVKPPTKLNL